MPVEVDPSQVHSIEVDPSQVSAASASPAQPSWLDHTMQAVKDYGAGLGAQINPVTMLKGARDAAYNAVTDPIGTVKAIGRAQGEVGQKAGESFKSGDYLSGVRHTLGYLLPIVGPAIDALGDEAASGHVAHALGGATGLGLTMAAPDSPVIAAAVKKLPAATVIPKFRNPNPAVADAVNFAVQNDIPVDAATATGNRFIKGVQAVSDHSPFGSVVAERAKGAQTQALTRVAGEVADQAYPRPAVPESAGEAVTARFNQKINALRSEADSHYDDFRNAAKNNIAVRSNGAGLEDIEMPVDLRQIKQNLQPLYDEMLQWMPVSSRNASEGFAAVKGLVEGPDYMAAPVAEKGLSGLKSLAREAASPDLRNVSQGIGADTAKQLQASIDAAALQAGPAALASLKNGRSAHAEKMAVADTLQKLRDEPVQTFNQLTYAGDSGIDQLRAVAKQAPKEMSMVGRAYLEKLFGNATAEGGFDKTGTIASQWQKLGPETKQILFKNPMLIRDLDRFFLFAKKAAENPNPSGSALVGSVAAGMGYAFRDPVHGIPLIIAQGALSKMLHSPAGVQALTEGLSVPLSNKAAASMAYGRILKLAGDQAKPAAAADGSTPTELLPEVAAEPQR